MYNYKNVNIMENGKSMIEQVNSLLRFHADNKLTVLVDKEGKEHNPILAAKEGIEGEIISRQATEFKDKLYNLIWGKEKINMQDLEDLKVACAQTICFVEGYASNGFKKKIQDFYSEDLEEKKFMHP